MAETVFGLGMNGKVTTCEDSCVNWRVGIVMEDHDPARPAEGNL
jgi:hypothetical protein